MPGLGHRRGGRLTRLQCLQQLQTPTLAWPRLPAPPTRSDTADTVLLATEHQKPRFPQCWRAIQCPVQRFPDTVPSTGNLQEPHRQAAHWCTIPVSDIPTQPGGRLSQMPLGQNYDTPFPRRTDSPRNRSETPVTPRCHPLLNEAQHADSRRGSHTLTPLK